MRLWFGYADPRIVLRSPKTTGHDTLGFQDTGGQPKIPVLPTMSEVFAPLLATINRTRIKRDATWVLIAGSVNSSVVDSSASTFRIALSLGFLYHCFTCRRDGREPHGSRLAFTRPARPVASQGFTPGQGNHLPSIGPVGYFRARAHISPLDWASSTDDYQHSLPENYFRDR